MNFKRLDHTSFQFLSKQIKRANLYILEQEPSVLRNLFIDSVVPIFVKHPSSDGWPCPSICSLVDTLSTFIWRNTALCLIICQFVCPYACRQTWVLPVKFWSLQDPVLFWYAYSLGQAHSNDFNFTLLSYDPGRSRLSSSKQTLFI